MREFILANKSILLEAEKISDENRSKLGLEPGKGWIGNCNLTFIDSKGNLAIVEFDYSKIESVQNLLDGYKRSSLDNLRKVKNIIQELQKYGFNNIEEGGFNTINYINVSKALDLEAVYEKRREEEREKEREKARKIFDL